MTWNVLRCSRCGLVVEHVSPCRSVAGVVLLGLLSAEAGSAHQGWEEWWNCERVKESSVHVVSVLVCFKNQWRPKHRVSITVLRGRLFTWASILVLSHCVTLWKVLYLDMCPLGLQALHAGQNLLLVSSQSNTHLSQFTARKTRKRKRESSTLSRWIKKHILWMPRAEV